MLLNHPAPESTLRARSIRPLHWGPYEVCSSCAYVILCALLIAAVTVGVLELIDFDSLAQVYGFNQIERAGS